MRALALSGGNLYVGGAFDAVYTLYGNTLAANNIAKWNGFNWSALGDGSNAANNQSIFLDTQIDISETGISMKDELSETKLQWKAFVKKQENADYYFLFTNSIQALIFPKRIFKTAEDKARFQQLLSQHLSFDAEVGHLIKD